MIIDKKGIDEFFNVKPAFRKTEKYTFPFFFFIAIFMTNFILNVSFIVSQNYKQDQ